MHPDKHDNENKWGTTHEEREREARSFEGDEIENANWECAIATVMKASMPNLEMEKAMSGTENDNNEWRRRLKKTEEEEEEEKEEEEEGRRRWEKMRCRRWEETIRPCFEKCLCIICIYIEYEYT